MGDAGLEKIDLSPTNLTSSDSVLKNNASKPLLEYLVAASKLATDHNGYRYAIDVSEDEYKQLQTMGELGLDELLKVQGEIKTHCHKFQGSTYPAIIRLASSIRAYADKVGGDEDTSYYHNLVEQIKILNSKETRDDPKKTSETKANIDALCEEAIADATALKDDSQKAYDELTAFEGECRTDEQNLGFRNTAIQRALESEGGKIATLNKEIQAARDKWWDSYRKFVIATTAAATSVLWLLIPVYGLIIMPIAAGVGSAEARALHKDMEDADDLIEKDSKEVASFMKLSFDISNVKTRTKALYDLIGPAITVVQKNKATWAAIADDIGTIQKEVNKTTVRIPAEFLAKMNTKRLIKEWNDVAILADDFRLNAYTTDNVTKADKTALNEKLQNIIKSHDK